MKIDYEEREWSCKVGKKNILFRYKVEKGISNTDQLMIFIVEKTSLAEQVRVAFLKDPVVKIWRSRMKVEGKEYVSNLLVSERKSGKPGPSIKLKDRL
jgi:hypothetical protein